MHLFIWTPTVQEVQIRVILTNAALTFEAVLVRGMTVQKKPVTA